MVVWGSTVCGLVRLGAGTGGVNTDQAIRSLREHQAKEGYKGRDKRRGRGSMVNAIGLTGTIGDKVGALIGDTDPSIALAVGVVMVVMLLLSIVMRAIKAAAVLGVLLLVLSLGSHAIILKDTYKLDISNNVVSMRLDDRDIKFDIGDIKEVVTDKIGGYTHVRIGQTDEDGEEQGEYILKIPDALFKLIEGKIK